MRIEFQYDAEIQEVMKLIEAGNMESVHWKNVKEFYRYRENLSVVAEVLLFNDSTVIPSRLRHRMLKNSMNARA